MASTNVKNSIPSQHIYDTIRALRREGWDTTVYWDGIGARRKVHECRANRKHVNIRGYDRDQYIHDLRTVVDGWVFEIYVRNGNGGYNRQHSILKLEEAITKAKEILATEAPAIPTWKRADLPEPFKLPDNTTPALPRIVRVHEAEVYRRNKKFMNATVETLISGITCQGVVAIAGDCTVSLDAATSPGNKAWFQLECTGTEGRFLIISDGEFYYPMRKVAQREKLSLDRGMLERLDGRDAAAIKAVLHLYSDQYSKQFA